VKRTGSGGRRTHGKGGFMLKSIVMMDLPIDEIAPIERWYEYTRLKSLLPFVYQEFGGRFA
jgi:hypothetical protein